MKAERVFFGTYLEIAEWWKQRLSVKVVEGEENIKIYFPSKLNSISFRIIAGRSFNVVSDINHRINEDLIYFYDIKADADADIYFE